MKALNKSGIIYILRGGDNLKRERAIEVISELIILYGDFEQIETRDEDAEALRFALEVLVNQKS